MKHVREKLSVSGLVFSMIVLVVAPWGCGSLMDPVRCSPQVADVCDGITVTTIFLCGIAIAAALVCGLYLIGNFDYWMDDIEAAHDEKVRFPG